MTKTIRPMMIFQAQKVDKDKIKFTIDHPDAQTDSALLNKLFKNAKKTEQKRFIRLIHTLTCEEP